MQIEETTSQIMRLDAASKERLDTLGLTSWGPAAIDYLNRTYAVIHKEASLIDALKKSQWYNIMLRLSRENEARKPELSLELMKELENAGVLLPVKSEDPNQPTITSIFDISYDDWNARMRADPEKLKADITRQANALLNDLDRSTRDLEAVFGKYGEKEGLKSIYQEWLPHAEAGHPSGHKFAQAYEGNLRMVTKLIRMVNIMSAAFHSSIYIDASVYDRKKAALDKIAAKEQAEKEIDTRIAQKESAQAALTASITKLIEEETTLAARIKTSSDELNKTIERQKKYADQCTIALKHYNKIREAQGEAPYTMADLDRLLALDASRHPPDVPAQ